VRKAGSPAFLVDILRFIVAEEEAPLEQLDGNDGEYKLKEHVDYHDVEDVLQRVDNAVKYCLKLYEYQQTSFKLDKDQ